MADPALLAHLLRVDVDAQLRPEIAVSAERARLHHHRTKRGEYEVDLLLELGGFRMIGIEVKASAAPGSADAKHLAWLRDELGDRFLGGVVLHTGPRAYPLGERITAAPLACLCG